MCSIASTLPYRDHECPVARELFATTLDVHLVTGDIPESNAADAESAFETADGRPANREAAIARLARCICADETEFGQFDAEAIAEFVAVELGELVLDAIRTVSWRHFGDVGEKIVLAGHGDFVLNRVIPDRSRMISLADTIGAPAARCAPAYAVARLAEEML